MADSLSLITAQVTLLDPHFTLISIPLEYYSLYVQPILRLLMGDDQDEGATNIPWTNRHEFLNLTITPLEVSIMCRLDLAKRYLAPVELAILSLGTNNNQSGVSQVAHEAYMVVQVDGQGLDAGQRVLELTGPLAMAGISIFFVSTYFSDYILVPTRSKRTVTLALEQRGFVFSQAADAFVSQLSPSLQQDRWKHDYMSAGDRGWSPVDDRSPHTSAPSTPPAKDIDELQSRTFKKLRTFDIRPQVDSNLRLVSCAGSTEPTDGTDNHLKEDLLQVLLSICPNSTSQSSESKPHFLSLTITAHEPISILLEADLLPRLERSLFGAMDEADHFVPILFDLRHLGFETTGIVGGVAGRLSSKQMHLNSSQDISPKALNPPSSLSSLDISFLSSAKSGAVMVKAAQLEEALRELEKGYNDAQDS